MERCDYEIPNLLILAGDRVLTFDGVADTKERGVKAVDYWLEMKGVDITSTSR